MLSKSKQQDKTTIAPPKYITKVAAYKQHNRYIPDDTSVCKTGRMKRGFSAEEIYRMISKDTSYNEKHHALLDAIDELEIMKMLNLPFEEFKKN